MKKYLVYFEGHDRHVLSVYAYSLEDAQERAEYQMRKSNRNPMNKKVIVKLAQ